MSLLPTMNQVQVEEGRLPEAEDECAVDADYLEESALKIGDTITLFSGTDDEITDSLKTDTFTITGAVSSPCYIAFQRGNTTIGDGGITAFLTVPEKSFSLDAREVNPPLYHFQIVAFCSAHRTYRFFAFFNFELRQA